MVRQVYPHLLPSLKFCEIHLMPHHQRRQINMSLPSEVQAGVLLSTMHTISYYRYSYTGKYTKESHQIHFQGLQQWLQAITHHPQPAAPRVSSGNSRHLIYYFIKFLQHPPESFKILDFVSFRHSMCSIFAIMVNYRRIAANGRFHFNRIVVKWVTSVSSGIVPPHRVTAITG